MNEREAILELTNPKSHLSRARRRWLAFLAELDAYVATPHVTSWWRTEEHNKEVGGLPNSKHLTGDAIDVTWVGDAPDPGMLQTYSASAGVRIVREGTHEHFQFET